MLPIPTVSSPVIPVSIYFIINLLLVDEFKLAMLDDRQYYNFHRVHRIDYTEEPVKLSYRSIAYVRSK